MELDIMSQPLPLKQSQEFAQQVEAAGFSGLYFTEGGRTAYLSCAAAGLVTRKITIGTAVALAFTRSPMVTAQIAWELADATDGRFILGLGTQVRAHIERRYSMDFSPPGPRMAEHIAAIHACFRAFRGEENLQYEGEFLNLSLMTPQWNPGPISKDKVPVYLSAVLPYMCRLVGKTADGVHIHPLHSPEYVMDMMLPQIQKGAQKAGRNTSDIVLEFHTMAAAGDTKAELEKAKHHARTMLAFYGSTPAYAPIFQHHGYNNMTRDLRDLQKAGKLDEMAGLITDEVLDTYCVTGTFDELADILYERYQDFGNIRVLSYSAANQWAKDPSTLQRWGEVAQKLKSKS